MLSTIVHKARLNCSPCKGEMPSASEAERVLKGLKHKKAAVPALRLSTTASFYQLFLLGVIKRSA